MSKKHKKPNSLGRCLIKDRFGHQHRKTFNGESMLHTTELQDGYDWNRLNLNSVTEENSFQEFLRTAELAGTEFQAEKLNITFFNPKQGVGLLTKLERQQLEEKYETNKNLLKIPRRPKWTADMTAGDLQRMENDAFLEWRRDLNKLQEDEDILLTPYEKNLEFWRQLWRVVERSDVVVQIVDGRNPLLFRNEDLEKYVKELNDGQKMNMILVNKADLLTYKQRQYWAEYFNQQNIQTAFFSATLAAEDLKTQSQTSASTLTEEQSDSNDSLSKETEENNDDESVDKNAPIKPEIKSLQDLKKNVHHINDTLDQLENKLHIIEEKIPATTTTAALKQPMSKPFIHNNPKLLNRIELIEFLKSIYKGPTYTPHVTTIGLVGYPNVGKSSTINTLMMEKKVSVSATPGKTKHFQTLYLDTQLMLCDCPGLVMPSFVLTKADMILNGILPIDQMRDHVPPINLLCSRIPRHILEDKYGIIIAKPLEGEDPDRSPYAEELLLAYGYNRGFMTANGQPDQSRSARYILKDYVNGRLLYCVGPPHMEQSTYQTYPEKIRKEITEDNLPNRQQRAMRINKNATTTDLDKQFFLNQNSAAHIKGRSNFPHIRLQPKHGAIMITSGQDESGSIGRCVAKPWRLEKKEKREKLRKKFKHLDEH